MKDIRFAVVVLLIGYAAIGFMVGKDYGDLRCQEKSRAMGSK